MSSMRDELRQFLLYLLSTMRVPRDFEEMALKQLSASEEDKATAKEAMIAMGFETIGFAAKLYRKVLGEPVAVTQIDDGVIPDAFRGSWTLRFRLPLWPDFDFVVNEHPDGQAWDTRFERTMGAQIPPLDSISDLQSWKFVKDEVTNCFGTVESGDAWDNWEELYCVIPSSTDGPLRRCLLHFDYQLLQSFEICG